MASEQPRMRLEMPFLLMAGMVISAFCASVGAIAAALQVAGIFTNTEIFGKASGPIVRDSLQNGTILTFVFLAVLGAIAWALWREEWWSRPMMVGFWLLILTAGAVQFVRGSSGPTISCLPIIGLVSSWAYLYGKGNVKSYYRVLESRAFPQRSNSEGRSDGVA